MNVTPLNVNDRWEFMKGAVIIAAERVCGRTKGSKRCKETRWWNEEVSAAVNEKKWLFKICLKNSARESCKKYQQSEQLAEKLVLLAKQ